ncbi:MAG: hypothetical protein HFH49_16165 [Lachnospiraceae bacterium]|nr:hypothetical protein [Lachnospiraceae bacterium]
MSMGKKPIGELKFSDLRVHYGTGSAVHIFGTGRNKKFRYRNGMMTDLGDLEIYEWKSLMNALIEHHGEQEIQQQLRQWSRTECRWLHSEDEVEEYALSLHAARIFEDPAWAGYVPFNRQYRPEILETAKLVWIKTSCCPKAGQITEKQLEKAVYMDYRIRCPHCGRFGDFHVCTPEELQEEKEI